MTGNAPLDGLRVVEGSAFVAAPSGGMTLAQLGAEVVRFDPLGGGIDYGRWPLTAGGRSLYWSGLNKGKKSLAVNLRDPAAHEAAHRVGRHRRNLPHQLPGPGLDVA